MSDPRARLLSIVDRELEKLDTASKMESMLHETHLKALEALSRVLKATTLPGPPSDEEVPPAGSPADVAAALASMSSK
jgi:hypothetical protein